MAPSAWDKAYLEKNLHSACKAFSKAASGQPHAAGRSQLKQPQGLPGLDELSKVLALLKALLTEAPHIIARALHVIVKEQLLNAVCNWLERSLGIMTVELAAGLAGPHAPPQPHQTNIHQAITSLQRLLRILTAMLKPYTSPSQLQGEGASAAAMLASTPFDLQPIDKLLLRVLHPMLIEDDIRRPVHSQYRHTVLGAALNMASAVATLALHPALQGSVFTTCVLEGACVLDLLPSMAGLLAHAAPAPGPGQSQDRWYESTACGLVELLAAAKESPAAVSNTFMQGWQRAVRAPMVQELLLERLIHGLRDASPSGLECPPGFDNFGLLPGRCCTDDRQLLRCLQLCLDAQWLAWRAAQGPQQQQGSWACNAGNEGTVLEPSQLFELTRQVAEQAIMVVAEEMTGQNIEEVDEEEDGGRQGGSGPPGQATLAALLACASCLTDMQHLWPGMPAEQQHSQLPLVLALAANTLAFASQGMEAVKDSSGAGADAVDAQADVHGADYGNGSAQAGPKALGNVRAFGHGTVVGRNSYQGNDECGRSSPPQAQTLRDCFTRAASMLAFFFPVHRESAALVGPLASLYSPQAWAGMAEQAGGVLGALEMALRGGHAAPTPAINILLLHALAGAMQAAPGSYWTHMGGAHRAGLLSTLRKVATITATALEANVAAAQAADALDLNLQQRANFMYRLLMLIVDGNGLLTAPTPAGEGASISSDHDFTGVQGGVAMRSSLQGQRNSTPGKAEGPSPSTVVMIQAGGVGGAGGVAPVAPGPQGRRGRGEANPDRQVHAGPVAQRVSEAQLQLRSWILAELLPVWLRLWAVQLSALGLAVQAEGRAQVVAVFQAVRGSKQPSQADRSAGAEAARYGLMRAGMEWLANVVQGAGPLCSSILAAHALHVSPAGGAGRTQLDPAILAVARAAKQLVSVVTALDILSQLQLVIQLETKRLSNLGVPEGQAGMLTTLAHLLTALVALPGSGKSAFARGALEHGMARSLATLYDEQRRLGGRVAAATATMDTLQVVAGAVEDVLSIKPFGGAKGSPAAAAQVAEARKMLGQLSNAPPPSGDVYTDEGFDAQACALIDVMADEALDTLKLITGPAVALDGLMASMPLHVGCCHPYCSNLAEEGEHLLQLHLCQGCMRVRYCSRACQVAAWARHQEQCKQWSSGVGAQTAAAAT